MDLSAPWYGACRLWLDANGSQPNMFMNLRRFFTVEEKWHDGVLRIMADSDFIACIDGVEVGRGQYPDDPDAPTYSDIQLPELAAGKHLLTLRVYHKGHNFSVYAPGIPGVVFALLAQGKVQAVSDGSCKVSGATGFRSGMMPVTTVQLGFTAQYDAREVDDSWQSMEFDDSSWQKPFAEVENRPMQLRPAAARPVLEKFIPGQLIKSGLMLRHSEQDTFAKTMSCDQVFWWHNLPEKGGVLERICSICHGWSLIYDLGEEKVGFIEFALNAPAGTIVDFAHGEHLDDGHVRMECFLRNFADRYICRGGGERFQLPFRRIGGRYIELHIVVPPDCSTIRVEEVGIVPWTLPLPQPCSFVTADEKLMTVRRLSIRTLEHCMHEHYEDCPWREQALYAYDSRNQMLYGYYLWGNYDFAAASLNLFGTGVLESGQIRLCVPSRMTLAIPVFSMIWPLQVYEHLLYSGDFSVWQRQREKIRFMCRQLLQMQEPESGLYQVLDPELWNFYEWTPGLDHTSMKDDEVHSLFNLYLANMLEAAGKLENLDGDAGIGAEMLSEAQRIRQKVEELFYLPQEDCYGTFLKGGKITPDRHEHVQIMMLYAHAVPEDRQQKVLQKLLACDGSMVPITLSVMPYLMEGMLRNDYGCAGRNFIRRKLEENYYPMLDNKSTTLWETAKGGDDFLFAGSLCHGWSSLPVYYCGAGLLGVVPLELGFKRFRVRPWSDRRESAAGAVPTPDGEIRVKWQLNSQNKYDLQVEYPAALEPVIEELPDTPLGEVVLQKY